jgi:hypothetical protein
MTYAIVGIAVVGFFAFVFLQPKFKAFISFFLMMQFFDIAPNILFGMYVWDYGAILMLVTALDVFLRNPALEPANHAYLTVLKVFLAWLLICFLWSLLVYQYPVMHTVKNARYMVLGYFMTMVFIRLFRVQPDSFEFLMKWFYRLTFVLMPVVLLQYVMNRPLLSGLVSDYEGALRAVPIFLPLCLLNFWIIFAKFLSSGKTAVHELIYLLLVLVTVALTYTRGIYIAAIFTAGLLLWTTVRDRTLKASSLFSVVGAGFLVIVFLFASGAAQKVGGRAISGLQLLGADESSSSSKQKDDTFTGRLGLAAERFSLVWSHNPLVGYGFIHEDDVPSDLRNSLKYGTVLGGTAADPTAYSRFYEFSSHYILGLYTADIAWADIAISIGWVGVLLLIAVMLTLVFGHYGNPNSVHPMGYAVKTGLFLQLMMMFLLTFDGNNFYGAVHIPAFLLAGYSLTRDRRINSNSPAIHSRPANLMT